LILFHCIKDLANNLAKKKLKNFIFFIKADFVIFIRSDDFGPTSTSADLVSNVINQFFFVADTQNMLRCLSLARMLNLLQYFIQKKNLLEKTKQSSFTLMSATKEKVLYYCYC